MCKEWLDKTGIFVNGNNVTTEENTGLELFKLRYTHNK